MEVQEKQMVKCKVCGKEYVFDESQIIKMNGIEGIYCTDSCGSFIAIDEKEEKVQNQERTRCKKCSTPLHLSDIEDSVLECSHCHEKMTFPKEGQTNDVVDLLNQGQRELSICNFDNAYKHYDEAIKKDPREPEAYFGKLLSEYNIQYLRDIAHYKENGTITLQPICHRENIKSIREDSNYKKAIELATNDQRKVYEKKIQEIEDIQEKFSVLEKEGKDFDCFICVKVSDQGQFTRDSHYANRLYDKLMKNGYHPFYSERSKESNWLGNSYEANILYGLYKAKCMIIICSNKDYLDTQWVKNEYSRYIEFMKIGKKEKGSLCIAYTDEIIEQLPGISYRLEGIKFDSFDSSDKLSEFVSRYCKAKENVPTYKVIYKNEDGTTLYEEEVKSNQKAEYRGETPKKKSEGIYEYEFIGWDHLLEHITSDIVTYARYRTILRKFNVVFKNNDGVVLYTDQVDYGARAVYNGKEPYKEEDKEYIYKFVGWNKSLSNISEDTEFVAEFEKIEKKKKIEESKSSSPIHMNVQSNYIFKVVFKNEDGSTLEEQYVEFGRDAEYNGPTPTKEQDEYYTYEFIGWDQSCKDVTRNLIVTPKFDKQLRIFTVEYKNYDGTVLYTKKVKCFECVKYEGEIPSRPRDSKYIYEFKDWDIKDTSKVTKDLTITAIYENYPVSSTITFKNYDGTILQSEQLEYGAKPKYCGPTPTRPASSNGSQYDFYGWEPEIGAVTHDQTYEATFNQISPILYEIRNNEAVVAGCKVNPTELIIPSSIMIRNKEYPVTKIQKGALSNCKNLVNLTIPFVGASLNGHSKTHFGHIFGAEKSEENPDYVPKTLDKVIITGGKEICSFAFHDCSSLTSIVISDTVTCLSSAFAGCSSLTSIVIPSSVTSIDGSFFGCYSLISIEIPDSVTSIGDYTFSNCYALKTITIPNSVTSIGYHAFHECSSLTSITIPNSVTHIGKEAFSECKYLTSIDIPSGVTGIGEKAFYCCKSLTSILIPNSVTSIGKDAFEMCDKLTIFCEASCKPSGWDDYWNIYLDYEYSSDKDPIKTIWGYSGRNRKIIDNQLILQSIWKKIKKVLRNVFIVLAFLFFPIPAIIILIMHKNAKY